LAEQEKAYVSNTLTIDGVLSKDPEEDDISWTEVRRAFTQPQSWFLHFLVVRLLMYKYSMLQTFLADAITYGMGYFEPTIVASLGHFLKVLLITVPSYAVAFFRKHNVF
jgi:hypothetical protein